jgi:hypothetical protein
MGNNRSNTRKIALNGILGALALISLFLATIVPTNRLALYALSSFFISVAIVESGIKAGWLFYASTALLALIILPDKLGLVPYVIFFGFYGIAKYYIEKLNKLIPEYILKILYFNLCLGIAYLLIRQLFIAEITVKLPWFVIVIALEIIFLIYDFVYTLFIAYYRDKLKKMLHI